MTAGKTKQMEEIYPHCRSCLGPAKWDELIEAMRREQEPDAFDSLLSGRIAEEGLPPFLPDLARLEGSIHRVRNKDCSFAPEDHPTVNPSLDLLHKLAEALDTTVADLAVPASFEAPEIPPSLRACQEQHSLPDDEIADLARIRFRGGHPTNKDDWYLLYLQLKRAIGDHAG